jgi:Domain of unknown function (DUF4286)
MIIYNVTIKTDWSIANNWLHWLLEEHIPEVMQTGCFVKYQVARLLDMDETDGPTFTIQYYADTMEKYNEYIAVYSLALRKKGMEKWGEHFTAFRSLMEVVN